MGRPIGYIVSEDTRRKLSVASKGRVLSDDHKRKISVGSTGHRWTEDAKSRASVTHTGSRHSEETKAKIAKAGVGREVSAATRGKLRTLRTGKALPKSVRSKISKSLTGRILSKEWRRKIGDKHKGKKISQVMKARLREVTLRRLRDGSFPTKNTAIELALKGELASRGISCIAQHALLNYQVDLFLPDFNIVIEADGCRFHYCPLCKSKWLKKSQEAADLKWKQDADRSTKLKAKGFIVFRFWEHEVRESAKLCIDKLGL